MAKRIKGHITVVDHQFLDGSIHTDAEFMKHADALSEQAFKVPAFADGVKRIYMESLKDKHTA